MILFFVACATDPSDTRPGIGSDLTHRAYVVSDESNEMFVFDYDTLDEIGVLDTTVTAGAVNGNHMAMVSTDGSKVYTTAADQDTLVVIDAATLAITRKVAIGAHATHMAMRDGASELWVMAEDDNAVVVLDTDTDEITHTITDASLRIPHFARFLVDTIVPDGLSEGACEGDPCGFADAQISPSGLLFASHFSTGKVVVYDTVGHELVVSGDVGLMPWSAFVDPFDDEGEFAFVPSWATSTVARVGRNGVASTWAAGDDEVYGVNFSPTAPGEAFV